MSIGTLPGRTTNNWYTYGTTADKEILTALPKETNIAMNKDLKRLLDGYSLEGTGEHKMFVLKNNSTNYDLITKIYFQTNQIWKDYSYSPKNWNAEKGYVGRLFIGDGDKPITTGSAKLKCFQGGNTSCVNWGVIELKDFTNQYAAAQALKNGQLKIQIYGADYYWWKYPTNSVTRFYFEVEKDDWTATIGSTSFAIEEGFYTQGSQTQSKFKNMNFTVSVNKSELLSTYGDTITITPKCSIKNEDGEIVTSFSFSERQLLNYSTSYTINNLSNGVNANKQLINSSGAVIQFSSNKVYTLELTVTAVQDKRNNCSFTPKARTSTYTTNLALFAIPLAFSPAGHIVSIGKIAEKKDDDSSHQRFLVNYETTFNKWGRFNSVAIFNSVAYFHDNVVFDKNITIGSNASGTTYTTSIWEPTNFMRNVNFGSTENKSHDLNCYHRIFSHNDVQFKDGGVTFGDPATDMSHSIYCYHYINSYRGAKFINGNVTFGDGGSGNGGFYCYDNANFYGTIGIKNCGTVGLTKSAEWTSTSISTPNGVLRTSTKQITFDVPFPSGTTPYVIGTLNWTADGDWRQTRFSDFNFAFYNISNTGCSIAFFQSYYDNNATGVANKKANNPNAPTIAWFAFLPK